MVELWWQKWVQAVGDAKRSRREAAQQAVVKRNLMRFVESSGNDSMLLLSCFCALRDELAAGRRAKAAEEMEKLKGMHDVFEERQRALVTKSAARMAMAFDSTHKRGVFVAWKTFVKEARAGEQQRQAVEKLTAKMMLLSESDDSIRRTYFNAYRDVMVKSKQRKKHLSKYESFAMSAAQTTVELWWQKWVQAVGDAKRSKREAAQQAVAKRKLMQFVENSGDASMLVRACFQALREEAAAGRLERAAAEKG